MESYGDNKRADKQYDREHDTDIVSKKIYSYSTFKTYWKHIKYFLKYVKENHPECKKLSKAERYVPEWLQTRVDAGLSAWTVQMETAALGKLYGISRSDPRRFQPPQRRREDIIRSRMTTERAISFEEKNTELVNFCKGCGFRRSVLEKLRGSDLYDRRKIEFALNKARADGDKKMIQACTDALTTFPKHDYFILHKGDKGGKTRISPIVGKNKDQIVARMKATKQDQLVWQHLNKHFDVHRYRSDYACSLYKQYERIEELNFHTKMRCADGKYRSEIYVCRGYDKGKQLDRRALRKVSIALGHSREDTAIANYLRNI